MEHKVWEKSRFSFVAEIKSRTFSRSTRSIWSKRVDWVHWITGWETGLRGKDAREREGGGEQWIHTVSLTSSTHMLQILRLSSLSLVLHGVSETRLTWPVLAGRQLPLSPCTFHRPRLKVTISFLFLAAYLPVTYTLRFNCRIYKTIHIYINKGTKSLFFVVSQNS